jgi:hypothetical protein
MRVRPALVPAVTLLCGLVALSACGGPPPQPTEVSSDVDRQRARVLSQEAILQDAVSPPEVTLGKLHSDRVGWDRTEVDAELLQSSGGTAPEPGAVEKEFATALATLRDSGWSVHWEMCLPPPKLDESGHEVNAVAIPLEFPRVNGYQWLAAAHKIESGVSYGALLTGVRVTNGALVEVVLRAPNARDNANLFPENPAALPVGKSCGEDGTVGDLAESAGTPTMIRDWWPFPEHNRDRDPNQV